MDGYPILRDSSFLSESTRFLARAKNISRWLFVIVFLSHAKLQERKMREDPIFEQTFRMQHKPKEKNNIISDKHSFISRSTSRYGTVLGFVDHFRGDNVLDPRTTFGTTNGFLYARGSMGLILKRCLALKGKPGMNKAISKISSLVWKRLRKVQKAYFEWYISRSDMGPAVLRSTRGPLWSKSYYSLCESSFAPSIVGKKKPKTTKFRIEKNPRIHKVKKAVVSKKDQVSFQTLGSHFGVATEDILIANSSPSLSKIKKRGNTS